MSGPELEQLEVSGEWPTVSDEAWKLAFSLYMAIPSQYPETMGAVVVFIAALEQDRRRLDWLEANQQGSRRITQHITKDGWWVEKNRFSTIREAIDFIASEPAAQ
jgi:hypothetical protein